jgi:transcriptional regulator with XRE-family HTH domain
MQDREQSPLAKLRRRKGLTQARFRERLVERLGFEFSTATMCRLEQGVIPPSYEIIMEMAEVLGVTDIEILKRLPVKEVPIGKDSLLRLLPTLTP